MTRISRSASCSETVRPPAVRECLRRRGDRLRRRQFLALPAQSAAPQTAIPADPPQYAVAFRKQFCQVAWTCRWRN